LWISFGIFLYKMNKSPHEFEIAVGLIRTAWFWWSGWPGSIGPDGLIRLVRTAWFYWFGWPVWSGSVGPNGWVGLVDSVQLVWLHRLVRWSGLMGQAVDVNLLKTCPGSRAIFGADLRLKCCFNSSARDT
jgi:hypothetical protein